MGTVTEGPVFDHMNVLITGGAGYLGSLLTPALLERGHHVTVYDSLKWGVNPLLAIAAHERLTITRADVRDHTALAPAVAAHDVIVNLAAVVGYPSCRKYPQEARETNLDAVVALTGMLRPEQRLIQASTGSLYGHVEGICTEETPITPLTLYGTTKASAEVPVLAHGGVALRFATVFGLSPRLRLDLLVNDLVYTAVQRGAFLMYEPSARRTFLHARDAAASILFTVDHYDAMAGHPFNVGDEAMNYTKQQVAELIQEQWPFDLQLATSGQDPDQRDYAVSYERIRALGFRATVSMEEGISELLRVMPLVSEDDGMRNG